MSSGALLVLGASGHGKVVADCAEACGWQSVVFFDDAWPELADNGHWPVVGNTDDLLGRLPECDGVIVAIGDNATRQKKLRALAQAGATLATLIHPRAVVSSYAVLGEGSVVFAGAVINADSRLGEGAIVNTGAVVDHDCVLGPCVHISPNAALAGDVGVGARSWVGIGASVRQCIRIGEDVMVGAGACVVSDVADRCTVVGVPAR